MVVSLKKNRRRMLVLLALIALLAVVYFVVCVRPAGKTQTIAGGTNEERLAYINSFGWTVEAEPLEIAEVTIPAKFNDVYTAYNELQLRQGFDLQKYAGSTCTQYKYTVTNYDTESIVYLCLLVRNDEIIGADISSAELGGFMHGINERPQASPLPAESTEEVSSAVEESTESQPEEISSAE